MANHLQNDLKFSRHLIGEGKNHQAPKLEVMGGFSMNLGIHKIAVTTGK